MNYNKWKRLSARRKAIWPADMKLYMHRQQKVTISLDSDLAEWLTENVIGRSSFTSDLEETVITALRIAKGELPAGYFPQGRQTHKGKASDGCIR